MLQIRNLAKDFVLLGINVRLVMLHTQYYSHKPALMAPASFDPLARTLLHTKASSQGIALVNVYAVLDTTF